MSINYGKWSQPGVPHKGWACVGWNDLGRDKREICEMCERMEIRYVHVMEHKDYLDTLRCGCVCAGNMSGDMVSARQREKTMRNHAAERHRLEQQAGTKSTAWGKLSSDGIFKVSKILWGVSVNGNPYCNLGNYHLVVYPRDGNWVVQVTHQPTGQKVRYRFATAEDAKAVGLAAVQKEIAREAGKC
jgi:hypothetical protein